MKFFPPKGQSCHISLLSGHTALVEPEGTELDMRFRKEAIARGCYPEGTQAEDPELPGDFNREEIILDAMKTMIDLADKDDFTAVGQPDVRRVSNRVGFTVDRHERDRLWAKLESELK
jgi:hypothetical protein